MKFADHHRRAGWYALGDVAQNSSRIIGVVQDHRDKGRARLHACGVQQGRIRDDPLNLSDAALGLQALQVNKSVSRAVKRINHTRRPHTLSQRKTDIAGPRAHFEHPITGFEAERIHPGADQLSPQRLARIDLIPTQMAEVLLEWLLDGRYLIGQSAELTIRRDRA